MKKVQCKSCGFSPSFDRAESIEEFDLLAGSPNAPKVGAALEEACSNIGYRSQLPRFREKLSAELEKATGIERKWATKDLKEKNADGSAKTTEVWTETAGVHIDRVLATEGNSVAKFADLAQQVADTCPFDPKESEPAEAKPRKPRKDILDSVNAIIAQGNGAQLAAVLSANLGRTIPAEPEAMALAVAEDLKRQEEEKKRNLFASIGAQVA